MNSLKHYPLPFTTFRFSRFSLARTHRNTKYQLFWWRVLWFFINLLLVVVIVLMAEDGWGEREKMQLKLIKYSNFNSIILNIHFFTHSEWTKCHQYNKNNYCLCSENKWILMQRVKRVRISLVGVSGRLIIVGWMLMMMIRMNIVENEIMLNLMIKMCMNDWTGRLTYLCRNRPINWGGVGLI